MRKEIICIECPAGCSLRVDIENCRVVRVEGNKCEKGVKYATAEVEYPTRVLATTVRTEGLELKRVPVRTDRAIPKEKLFEAMKEVRKVAVKRPGSSGDAVAEDILGEGVKLIATRDFF